MKSRNRKRVDGASHGREGNLSPEPSPPAQVEEHCQPSASYGQRVPGDPRDNPTTGSVGSLGVATEAVVELEGSPSPDTVEQDRTPSADELWMRGVLEPYGIRGDDVKVYIGPKKTTVRRGPRKVLGIDSKWVLARDEAAVQRKLEIPHAVRLNLVIQKDSDADRLLWGVKRFVPIAMNRVIDESRLALRTGASGMLSPRKGTEFGITSAAYHWVKQELEAYRALMAKQAASLAKHKDANEHAARRLRDSQLTLSGHLASLLSKRAVDQLMLVQKERKRGIYKNRTPDYTARTVFLSAPMYKLVPTAAGWVFKFCLEEEAKDGSHWKTAIAVPAGGKDHGMMRLLQEGKARLRDARIQFDDRHKTRLVNKGTEQEKRVPTWYAMVGISTPRLEQELGDTWVAVKRSTEAGLYAVGSDGFMGAVLTGEGIGHQKMQFMDRRKRWQRSKYDQGKNARGHGKDRFNRPRQRLSDMEARATKQYAQNGAAALDRLCRRRGYSRIVIESFGEPFTREFLDSVKNEWTRVFLDHFPFGILKNAVTSMAVHTGRELVEVEVGTLVNECPGCGSKSKHLNVTRRVYGILLRRMKCAKCGLHINLDLALGWNMLKMAGAPAEALEEVVRRSEYETRARMKEVEEEGDDDGSGHTEGSGGVQIEAPNNGAGGSAFPSAGAQN